jgi:hypothetical protein
MSCLWEGACLVCSREHVLFVGGSMSCLWTKKNPDIHVSLNTRKGTRNKSSYHIHSFL